MRWRVAISSHDSPLRSFGTMGGRDASCSIRHALDSAVVSFEFFAGGKTVTAEARVIVAIMIEAARTRLVTMVSCVPEPSVSGVVDPTCKSKIVANPTHGYNPSP